MKVLIVNPDDGDRAALVRLVQDGAAPGELALSEASSAADALRLFRKDHPDLILLSTHDLSRVGREIAATVRAGESLRHTGIIFIDGRPKDDSSLSVECLEMGADDFLRHGCTAAELMARLRAVLRLKAMTDELRSANHKLRVLSLTDELTGLANMRSFNQRFSDILRRCRKGRLAVGVMMIDLDHFKSVNDSTNHLVGSFVISEVGKLIGRSDALNHGDVAARYGGDEFIIACAAAGLDDLYLKAESLRRLVAGHTFERDGCTIRITASVGGSWVPASFGGRAEDLIKAADLMLYQSKNAGRNRASGMILKYPLSLEVASAPLRHVPLNDEDDSAETGARIALKAQ
jgi:diguanylate cyclase (GGDEF)-like protein